MYIFTINYKRAEKSALTLNGEGLHGSTNETRWRRTHGKQRAGKEEMTGNQNRASDLQPLPASKPWSLPTSINPCTIKP